MKEIDLSIFRHKIRERARFYQVDSFQVLHNVHYLFIMENARIDYFREIGLPMNLSAADFLKKFPLMVVHNSANYFASVKFDEEIEVYTRIEFIKNSSLGFENVVTLNGNPVVTAKSILVSINPKTSESQPLPNELRELIEKYEKDNLIIIQSKND